MKLALEELESRTLMSTATSAIFEPDIEFLPHATGSATVLGYTPAQIRNAYGFDQVSLANGTVAADGRGQTIAIIDAFNDPNIAADLNVFSSQFGLPAANLTVVNQAGGTKLPATDAGWAGEIALDVEWAHAIAPAANILLVEANSAQDADLMAAVDYARRAAGVSVISMSWGGSEFFSFTRDESATQLAFDQTFTTPAGHAGVTFIASAGDSGTSGGVQWPASSPNVLAVGGTSLQTQDATGTYLTEGPWRGFRNGTSGGFSRVEAEPSWQQDAQQSGARSTPDVGYNGDPSTGFAVYDSLPYQGFSGWDVVGGTSAGAPQWAGLIAIANQGRALAGLSSLDGPTQTLPDLYSVYSPPGTDGYSTTYLSAFHDIGNDGYGYTTGLGTPKAAVVVATLVGSSATPIPTPIPTPAALPPSPLTVAFSSVPIAGIGGEPGSTKLRLTNASGEKFTGPITITLYASTDATTSSDDATVTTLSLRKLNLRAGGSKVINLKFTRPADLADGSYEYIASTIATGTGTAPAVAVTGVPIPIEAPTIDLASSFTGGRPVRVRPGHSAAAPVTLTNDGNVTATGTLTLTLYASSDPTLDASDAILTSLPTRTIRVKAGKSLRLHVHFSSPADRVGGSYYLIASITPTVQPADPNTANNTASIATA